MKNVLIIGAGRSATSLIQYLLEKADIYDWHITVTDMSLSLAQEKVKGHPRGTAMLFDATNPTEREAVLQKADMVISMLPANMHVPVAKDCLRLGKNLATASYVSPELNEMHEEIQKKGLIFINEIGLDPGIDHMSTMQMINDIKSKGGNIQSFYSYTGGLVAPESDNNPWHYKFSWNPRNVVVAGQSVAQYSYENRNRYVPYSRLFANSELVYIPKMGWYDGYPNRDSLKYKEAYGLNDTPTILRGTLRHKGFCKAWNILVQLGLTDDSYKIENVNELTYAQWLRTYLPPNLEKQNNSSIRVQIASMLQLHLSDEALDKVEWLGLFSNENIPLQSATPAQILQELLERKWKLEPQDKDMIIMQHEMEYEIGKQKKRRISTLVYIGKNSVDTAMSELVGLPLAIGVKHILLGNIKSKGVVIPITEDIYKPIMAELEADFGVKFDEMEVNLESFNDYF